MATTATETETETRRGDRPRTLLVAGDLTVVVTVVVAGALGHGTNPVGDPIRTLDTLAPFLIGWGGLALLLGVYTRDSVGPRTVAAAWLGAANVGLILRGSPFFHGGTTWPFPLVVTGTVLLALLVWRAVAGSVLSA